MVAVSYIVKAVGRDIVYVVIMDVLFKSRKTTELSRGNVRMRCGWSHYCHVCGGYHNAYDWESVSFLN